MKRNFKPNQAVINKIYDKLLYRNKEYYIYLDKNNFSILDSYMGIALFISEGKSENKADKVVMYYIQRFGNDKEIIIYYKDCRQRVIDL